MFEWHTTIHFQYHHPELTYDLSLFDRGPKDTSPRPGNATLAYGRVHVGRGRRPKEEAITAPVDDAVEIVEDIEANTVSFAEIVES